MKTNFHTHTKRCLHAGGTEEDYIHSALEAGVAILGFSDHAPFPDYDFGLRMPFGELEAYFSAIDRLTKVYEADILIKKSLEIEYLPQYRAYYPWIIRQYRTDYLILGEHFFLGRDGELHNITTGTDGTALYIDYARAVAEGLETGCFDIVAHPDIFTMNRFGWDDNCDAATEILLDAAARTDTILEYNANGYRRGLHDYPDGRRLMYPHRRFWEAVALRPGLRVIVGSDCHGPEQVWDESMERSFQALEALGITPVLTPDRPGGQA